MQRDQTTKVTGKVNSWTHRGQRCLNVMINLLATGKFLKCLATFLANG